MVAVFLAGYLVATCIAVQAAGRVGSGFLPARSS